jgi:hypothetical protein
MLLETAAHGAIIVAIHAKMSTAGDAVTKCDSHRNARIQAAATNNKTPAFLHSLAVAE